ncbi:hypothetical protein B0H34DRAFT_243008 [Crassisporium funariophilum]|nr:hypothetical protein B0H34DRAFT_243008 [Crassisporium funariophilum]
MKFSSSLCVALLAIVPVFSLPQGNYMRYLRDIADIGTLLDARGLYFNARDIDTFLGYLERRTPPSPKDKGKAKEPLKANLPAQLDGAKETLDSSKTNASQGNRFRKAPFDMITKKH